MKISITANFTTSILLTAIIFLGVQFVAVAQDKFQMIAFPGYHMVNSDYVTGLSDENPAKFTFGGRIALQRSVYHIPFEFSLGYSQSRSNVFESDIRIGTSENYSIDLRYTTIPAEILWVNRKSKRAELSAGLNITPQYRTIVYNFVNRHIDNDRLLSLGFGLSGRASLILSTFDNGKGEIFGNFSFRWTEFMFHNARNRNVDDFSFRHLVVTPQIGVAYFLN